MIGHDPRPAPHLHRGRRTRAPHPGRRGAQPDALGGQFCHPRARKPLRRRPLPPGRPAHRAHRGGPHLPARGPGDAEAGRGGRTGAVGARRPQPRLAHRCGQPDDRQLLAAGARRALPCRPSRHRRAPVDRQHRDGRQGGRRRRRRSRAGGGRDRRAGSVGGHRRPRPRHRGGGAGPSLGRARGPAGGPDPRPAVGAARAGLRHARGLRDGAQAHRHRPHRPRRRAGAPLQRGGALGGRTRRRRHGRLGAGGGDLPCRRAAGAGPLRDS